MKRLLIFAAAVFAAGDPPSAPMVGRYQLTPASWQIQTAAGTSIETRSIFKLDTATGRTWRYQMSYNSDAGLGSRVREGWVEIGAYPLQTSLPPKPHPVDLEPRK